MQKYEKKVRKGSGEELLTNIHRLAIIIFFLFSG